MTWLNFLLTSLLFEAISFVRETEQAPSFLSTPSSPLYPVENYNITLHWTYTLDGSPLDQVEVIFTPDSPSPSAQRIARHRSGGTTQVASDVQDRFVFSLTDSQSTMTILRSQRSDSGVYELTVTPDDFAATTIKDSVKISVKYASKINYTSGNQTLNESDTLHLTCVADGDPTPNITWTRVSDNKAVSFPLIISGKQDEGGYKCTASNGIGSPDSRIVHVFVQNYHPINTNVTTNLTDNTVLVNETFSITCSAQANPPAKYQFYKGNECINGADNNAVITTSVSERVKMVNYSCIPFNFYGNGTTKATAVTVHYPALIESPPVNEVVLEKGNVTLPCNATGNPTPNITWTKGGSFSVLHQGDIYNIVNVPRDAAGNYTCTAWNGVGAQKKATAVIAVHYPPSIKIHKKEVIVVEGHNTSLACNVSGKPEPAITWTKQGSSKVLSNTSSLDVVNVSRHDATDDMIQCQCTASNGVGTPATATVNITVYYTSAIKSTPGNQVVLEGNNLTLHCNASGNPSPNITWTRDKSSSVLHQGNIYNIVNIHRDAAGNYKCTAWNGVGEQQNATAVVAVHYGADIISAPKNKTVLEFDNVTFFCNASSNPPSQIIWTQEGNSTVLHKGETFVIENVSRKLNGQRYKCRTWNNVTKDAEAHAQLSVYYAPGGAKLISVPSNTTVLRKSPLNLTCRADASPEAKFDLYFNGRLKRTNSSGIFNVTVMSDGVYTCVPFNKVGAGKNVSVNVTAVEAPSVSVLPEAITINDGNSLNLTCNASGKPEASIKWTVVDNSEVLSTDSRLTVNVSRQSAKKNMIQYQCTASNGVGTPATATVNVTVHYAPAGTKLISVPSNTTVLRKSPLSLTCRADASPEAKFDLYFNGRLKRSNSSGIFNVTVMSDGVYTCVPFNKVGAGKNANVSVTAVEAPSVSVLPEANTIIDGNSVNLTCNVSGKPEASIKWTMVNNFEVLSTDSRLTVNVSRQSTEKNVIQYQCTASNGVGTPATATASVTVHYPAMFPDPENVTVNGKAKQKVNLLCSGDGSPKPTITFTAIHINGSRQILPSGNITVTVGPEGPFLFQCSVLNYLANRTRWFHIALNIMKIEMTMSIENKDCGDNTEEITKETSKLVTDILKKKDIPVEDVKPVALGCGSVKVYFSLTFSQNVELGNVLTILMKAAVEKKFGDLQVDPNSIRAISPERIPKTTTPTLAPMPTDGDEGSSEVSKGLIFGLATSGVILLSVTFAGVIYCFYKRRKCRKDPRVHNSRSEERPCSLSQNDYCQVNNGYAEAGPQSTEVANLDHHQGEEGAAAVPNYAVVVKSKKKDKKKEKKGAEMNPCEDEYAVVDKSKKKTKKNEPDATYAEVDLLKKSKKPKPGEVLYADLGEFHHMKKMPEISTSPKTLPPINRPDPYAETQYADITQFLKGNPGDAGAEPPKDSTTTAVGKEESLAGNTGDGAEGTNETGF